MNIQEMLKDSVAFYQNFEQKNKLYLRPETRMKIAYVNLDVILSKLANEISWFNIRKKVDKGNKKNLILKYYIEGLNYYLLISNLKNWNQIIIVSKDKQKQLSNTKESKDLSNFYLSIKNMLFNSYFFQRKNDFVYSWKLFLKLGLSDLHLTDQDIINEFNSRVKL